MAARANAQVGHDAPSARCVVPKLRIALDRSADDLRDTLLLFAVILLAFLTVLNG